MVGLAALRRPPRRPCLTRSHLAPLLAAMPPAPQLPFPLTCHLITSSGTDYRPGRGTPPFLLLLGLRLSLGAAELFIHRSIGRAATVRERNPAHAPTPSLPHGRGSAAAANAKRH